MTLHTAKGLEFPVVFLTGLEDGIFPHMRSLVTPRRSKRNGGSATSASPGSERLYLCHAWCRQLFGSTDYYPPSRFLAEIPEELIESQGPAASTRVGEWHRLRLAPRAVVEHGDRVTGAGASSAGNPADNGGSTSGCTSATTSPTRSSARA